MQSLPAFHSPTLRTRPEASDHLEKRLLVRVRRCAQVSSLHYIPLGSRAAAIMRTFTTFPNRHVTEISNFWHGHRL